MYNYQHYTEHVYIRVVLQGIVFLVCATTNTIPNMYERLYGIGCSKHSFVHAYQLLNL